MTDAKHTPGPWRTVMLAGRFDARVASYGIAYGPAGNRLAIVEGEGRSSAQNTQNANLIAAAPDLLEALKDARYMLYGNGPGNPKIDAAIAKAEGQP